jgi:hypothetical protein
VQATIVPSLAKMDVIQITGTTAVAVFGFVRFVARRWVFEAQRKWPSTFAPVEVWAPRVDGNATMEQLRYPIRVLETLATSWGGLSSSSREWEWEAPRTMRHPRDFGGPAIYVLHHARLQLAWHVWLITAVLFSVLGLLAVLAYVPPGDVGLWHTIRRDLPGSRRQPQQGPGGIHDPWVLRACGRVTPIASVMHSRLRRRARWVRVAEAVLGTRYGTVGSFFRGRWTPDLPSRTSPVEVAYLLGTVLDGARCLGGGTTMGQPDQAGQRTCNLYVVLDVRGTINVVYPALLAKLRLYALCRKRDVTLLGALRTRAVEWCKAESLDTVSADIAVSGALGLAMMPSTLELTTRLQVDAAVNSPPFRHSLG